MAKRKRRGLRGLSGTPAEHEHEAQAFMEKASHNMGAAMRAQTPGAACRAARLGLVSSAMAIAEAGWTQGSPTMKRARMLYRRAETSVDRHCSCRKGH